MNVGQLAAQPPSQVQRVASDAEDVSSEFLSIRMLNNRARVRLSEPLDLTRFPSKAQLLTVASDRGWFVAIKRSSSTGLSLIASTVSDLRARLLSADGKNDEPIAVSRAVPLPQGVNPNYLVFASNESKLLVGLAEGAIIVYDANAICSAGTDNITPIHTFPATTSTSARHIYPNPGDLPDLVAVLREPDGNPNTQLVEILDVTALQSVAGWRSGGTPQTLPMSISWSPKGKQIAIGMQSGDIMTFSPTEVNQPKMFIPKPPSARNQSAIHTTWLANPTFYTIYAPLPLTEETDQAHFIISYDGKRNSAADVAVPISFFSSGLRPPGAFTVVLRNWGPAKIMLIVGDTTTADIGVIVSVAKSATEDKWQRLTLDDVATPSMPLGEEASETTMVGLELDLKNQQRYNHTMPSGENLEVPPPPIMFAYASDGTVIAWYLINTQGISYPGMTADSATTPSAVPQQSAQPVQSVQPVQPAQSVSSFGQPVPSAFGQSSGFGARPTSTFGQPAFGPTSAFGQASGSGFGQSSGSAFGQSNTAFGQNNTRGFGTFANAGPSGFGTSAFSSAPTTPAQPMVSEPTDSMSTDAVPDFGGLSLGASSNDTAPKAGFGTTGLFGATSQPAPVPSQPASGFADYIKPSAGFGAFSNYVQPLAQSKPPVSVEPPKAPSAFGQTGFGSLTTRSTFGQSAFGKPAFGQTGFASSPMSTTPQASPMSTTSSSAFGGGGGGAFGNYAGGQSAFAAVAQNATPTVPVWKTAGADKPAAGFSAFGGSGGSTVFGQQAPAANSQATPSTPPPALVQPALSTTTLSSTPPPIIALEGPTLTPPTVPATPAASAPTVTPAISTTPTAPPPAGAFANLQTVPAPFGSTSSFGGTFGTFNKDSPFANPKPVSGGTDFVQRMSAFSNTPAQPTPSTSGSAFGQTSAFGVRQSAFGQPSTPPATTTTTPKAPPSTSVFSAFSGQQSAFNQFAGPQKSFSDMLREGKDDDEKGKGKTPVSVFSSTPQTPVKSAEESTSTTPAKTPPPSLLAQQKGKSKESSVEPAENDTEKASKGKSTDEAKSQKTSPRAKISADESSLYLSESLSSLSSSFVEVDAPKDSEGDGDADVDTIREPPSPDSEEGELERLDDGIDGFLSSPEQSEGQYEGDEEDDSGAEELGRITEVEEEAEEVGKDATEASPLTPTKVALPPSRSPSTTPKPQTPFIKLEPSTPKLDRAQSTTPPGSPSRDPPETPFPPPVIAQPSPIVPSPSQIPSLTSLNIGIGRPSTRPLRSSPLASTPLSGVNNDEEGKRESAGSAKPRPASPKIPFGQWAAPESKPSSFGQQPSSPSILELPVGGSSSEKKSPRPKTPPLLSSFGFGKSVQPTATSSAAVNAPLPAGKFPPPIKPYGPGLMGPPVVPPSGSPFGQSAQPVVAPASKPLGAPAPLFGQVLPTAQKIVPAQQPKAEETLEEGIQKECAYLVIGLAKELESLRLLAQEANKKREELDQSKSAPSSGKGPSVTFDDVSMLGKSLKATMKEITELENMRESLRTSIREVQSNMLKAKTRKEEIVRFDKAKSDVEFTKMLKTRSLGPEYVESQTQLRRDIRAMRDLIEKLEGHLQSSKRRLNQLRTGKPGINPPSLDTINRTFRNIDITVEQQTSDVNNLAVRIAQLDLKGNLGSPIRDNRLPDDVSRRPLNVTPHVASSTAAALNAERSAHRLKEALLRVRKEPLLNVTAASAPPAPRSFETPKKKTSGTKDFDASFSLSDFEKPLPALSLPTEFPPFSIDPHASLSSGSSRNRTNWKSRHHHEHPQVPVKSGGVGTPAAPPAFDWGPLPGVKPMTTLPMDVRNNLR